MMHAMNIVFRNFSSITALLLLNLASTATAQTASPSVLDGVYTNAQAQRGGRTYQNICSHCHEGGEPDADPLFGTEFIDRWREAPLSYLHGFFSTNMPADEPGTLSAAVYVDVLAFLLKENGYPAGAELKAEQLDAILLVGENGPQLLPNNSLVRVAGCVVDSDNWYLDSAAAPTRVRTSDETTPEELALSAAAASGSARYVLQKAEDDGIAEMTGKRVQAKGVFTQGAPPAISVLSLETLGSCE